MPINSRQVKSTCVEQQQQGCLEGSKYELNGFCIEVGFDMAGPQSIHPAQFAVLGGELIELFELLHAVNHLLWQCKVHMLQSNRRRLSMFNYDSDPPRRWQFLYVQQHA